MREVVDGLPNIVKALKSSSLGAEIAMSFAKMHQEVARLQTKKIIRDDIEPMHIMMSLMGLLGSSMIQAQSFSKIAGTNFDDFLKHRKQSIILILKSGLARPKKL